MALEGENSIILDCETLHRFLGRTAIRFKFNKDGGDTLFKPYFEGKEIEDLGEKWQEKIFRNGVYIMFEKGEKFGDIDRIVRIGINREDYRLFDRLKSHYLGTCKNSVFREHIGNSLANPLCPLHKDGTDLETQISEYIQNNISFSLIPIRDKKQREQLESMLIATVNKSDECIASDNWLGKFHSDERINKGKLWNIQGLNSQPLDEEYSGLVFDRAILPPDISSYILDD